MKDIIKTIITIACPLLVIVSVLVLPLIVGVVISVLVVGAAIWLDCDDV